MKNPIHNRRHKVLGRLGLIGMALILSLGIPAASDIGPIPASEASAQEPSEPFWLGLWGLDICIGWCLPGYGFCCGYPEPLL